MFSRSLAGMALLTAATLWCSAAYGAPAITTVGTASARGNMRVDGNQVTGDATLFEGSTLETSAASARIRMDQHTVIEVATASRVVVHANYITLEQGSVDIWPTCGFVVESNGVRVTPNALNTHAVVSHGFMKSQSGDFFVLDNHGRILHRVGHGNFQTLSADQPQPSGPASYVGNLNIHDGHRLLTLLAPDTHTTYELQGKKVDKVNGNLVEVEGTIDPNASSPLIEVDNVLAHMKDRPLCTVKASPYWLLAPAAAAGIGIGVAVTQPPASASR